MSPRGERILAPLSLGNSSNITRPGLTLVHPPFGEPLPEPHPGLGRLLGDRAVRVDFDPHLARHGADVPGDAIRAELDLALVT